MKPFYWLTQNCLKAYFYLVHRHRTYGRLHLPKGPCIIAPNHASFYDPPILALSCNEEVYFLARKTLFDHFLFGSLIKHLNAFPVAGTAQDLAAFKLIFQLLKEKKKVVIFPEGERTLDGSLTAIKSGIGMISLKSHCLIVPTYIHGTFSIWPITQKLPKIWGKTACVFGTPISGNEFKGLEKKQALEAVAHRLRHDIIELRSWYLKGAIGLPP